MSDGSTPTPLRVAKAPFGVVAALTFGLVAASVMIVLPLVILSVDVTVVEDGLVQHKQNAESFIYLFSFAVVLPFWLWMGPRLADRIQAGPNGGGLSALTGLLVALLAAAVVLVRLGQDLPWGDGIHAVLVAGLLWAAVAVAGFVLAARGPWEALNRVSEHTSAIWWSAAGLLVLAGATFTRFGHIDLPALLVSAVVLAGLVWGYGRFRGSLPVVWRRVLDVLAFILVLLAVPDMIIVPVERIGPDTDAWFVSYIVQFHQALWLGAASQVQGGSGLLVDTVSQYGIAPIYLLAGLFEFIPIGNGTIGFIDGFFQGVVFAIGFGILRMAGVRLGLACAAMFVAVFALIYAGTYPIGGLLQHGALRFGLPILVIAPTVAAFRWPRYSRPARLVALAVVGLSSIWALEAFLYVTFSYLGIVLIQVAWKEPGTRLRWLLRGTLYMVAAWAIFQVTFALVTLIAYGSLPEWGLYLTYLRDFLGGDIGDLTYNFTIWSRGLGVAAIYMASVIGLFGLVTRLPDLASARRPAVVALAGLTAYGIALFSYFDNRSLDHILPYVSLPALLVVTIWLALLLERVDTVSLGVRRAAVAAACLFAALLVSVAWPSAGHRASDSLLAYVVPGGPSLSSGFDRLWNPPPLKAGAADGEDLVERYMADQDEIAVITTPDLDVEIVTRTDKPNALGITDAKEMSWVFGPHRETVDEDADKLGAGDLMLVDGPALQAFDYARKNPDTVPALTGLESSIEPVQRRILSRIAANYDLEKVATSPSGLTVVRLEPR